METHLPTVPVGNSIAPHSDSLPIYRPMTPKIQIESIYLS